MVFLHLQCLTEVWVNPPAYRQAGGIGQECLQKSYQAGDLSSWLAKVTPSELAPYF